MKVPGTVRTLRPVSPLRTVALRIVVTLLTALLCCSRTTPVHAQSSPTAATATGTAEALMQREQERLQTIAHISPSVVCVMAADGNGGGSGVLISADGYAVSNYHVVSGSGPFMKCGLSDGRLYDAVLVGIDPTGDVALIKLTGRTDFSAATPGNSDHVQVGQEVLALGNPFLLASDFTPTVTYGIVSGINRYQYPAGTFLEYTDCIQIDASINPGNSGGPLFDLQGRWIGINGRASFEKRGRVNAGAAYAISVRQVLLFIEHLRCGLIVDHGIADFTVETSTERRVMVRRISEVSEAWRRGLRPQSELIAFAGRSIGSANDFQNILGIFPEGTRLPVTWRDRDGIHTRTIRLRPLHDFQQAPELPQNRRRTPEDPDDDQPVPLKAAAAAEIEVPPELQEMFEQRDGFANYHFNRRQQELLLNRLRTAVSPSSDAAPGTPPTWAMKLLDAEIGDLVVGEAGAGFTAQGRDWYQPADQLNAENEPATYPGLLAAALQWHRLFNQADSSFDEVLAHGRLTHLPSNREGNILVTRKGSCTSWWYFDPEESLPFAVDVEYEQGVDELRIQFDGWNTSQTIPVPSRLGLVDADTEQLKWLGVSDFIVRKPGEEPAKQTTAAAAIRADSNTVVGMSRPATALPVDSSLNASQSAEQLQMIRTRQQTIVKLFGAGVGNLDSYGTGILISAEGHVLTVWNHLINVGFLTAVDSSGMRYNVRVMGTSREHDVAVLQLETTSNRTFPYVDLSTSTDVEPGTSVLAFSNMFRVATGNESVSVMHGVVAAKTPLTAGFGRWEFPVKTPVLIIDAVTNNSGAAGGLLTTADGQPAGMIGREIRHRVSQTWVNYSVPLTTLAPVVDQLKSGIRVAPTAADSHQPPAISDRLLTARFGMTLLPPVVERTPAYIDRVAAGSVAEQAGLQRGDLIVLLEDDVITSEADFRQQLALRRPGQRVSITVTRQQQLINVELRIP